MCNFELAWEVCLQELVYEQAGETFTAAIVAFRSRDIEKIQYIVNHAFSNDETLKGLISALGWLPNKLVSEWLKKFLYSKNLNHKYLAVAVCSIRRKNPGEILAQILTRDDCLAHHQLLIRALRLVGELKLYSLVNIVQKIALNGDEQVQFWAYWSLVLLGEHKYIKNLFSYVNASSRWQFLATQMVFQIIPVDKARSWISELSKQPEMQRMLIHAIAHLGDPHVIPWLIMKMHNFETAKIAGEAFAVITGIDLERNNLVIDTPKNIVLLPNDDIADENVNLDEDENLPFPDVNKINHIWLRYRDRYRAGRRYVMGVEVSNNSPIVIEKLNRVLQQSSLRQRQSVALSIALLDPQSAFINSKARVC